MVASPERFVNPQRPASRVIGAWHENPYQRNSALDMAKRLVRAGSPEPLNDVTVAKLLKRACGAPRALPLHLLPSLFQTRVAFFAAVMAHCAYRADEERNTPKRLHALGALTAIAHLPHIHSDHRASGFVRPNAAALGQQHTPATRALLYWTGIDVRGKGNGIALPEKEAQLLWQACVKAAAWQRAVDAAKQPAVQPITVEMINLLSVPEVLDAAETWLFSQTSPIERNDMSQENQPLPLNEDGYEEVLTLHAPKQNVEPDANSTLEALRQSAAALGAEDEDEDTGEFDLGGTPEPALDAETPSEFRARLMKLMKDAGFQDLARAFREAVGEPNLDAAIGKGLTRAEVEARITAFVAKNAQADERSKDKGTASPKSENERLPAPKSQGGRNPFTPARASGTFIRMALFGPSGSGKSYTALNIACNIKPNARVAVIDSERGSARLYAKQFNFDVVEIGDYSPQNYIDLLLAAELHGYDVVVVDSLSHAWMGTGGVLDMVDKARAKSTSGNSFTAWKDATPMQNKLVDTILSVRCHVIATLRVKTEWVLETNDRGKQVPRKVGLAPVQRDGIEYEFTLCGEINADHELYFTKSRCPRLADASFPKAGGEVSAILREWLEIE